MKHAGLPLCFLFRELVNENVQLKRTCEYFFQIQGQMAICKAAWCDFVVWIGDSVSVERVLFDEHFWQLMVLCRLVPFYTDHAEAFLQQQTAQLKYAADGSLIGRGSDDFEILYDSQFCQAKIGGRNGSNACTIIFSLFVQ